MSMPSMMCFRDSPPEFGSSGFITEKIFVATTTSSRCTPFTCRDSGHLQRIAAHSPQARRAQGLRPGRMHGCSGSGQSDRPRTRPPVAFEVGAPFALGPLPWNTYSRWRCCLSLQSLLRFASPSPRPHGTHDTVHAGRLLQRIYGELVGVSCTAAFPLAYQL